MSKLTGLWKIVKNMIPPEQMRNAFRGLIQTIIDQKKDYPVEKGEIQQIAFFFEQGGKTYFSIGFVNEQNKIVRQQDTQTTDEMIEKFLSNI